MTRTVSGRTLAGSSRPPAGFLCLFRVEEPRWLQLCWPSYTPSLRAHLHASRRKVARKQRRPEGCVHLGFPLRLLHEFLKNLTCSDSIETMTEELLFGSNRSEKAEEALLGYCEANEAVKSVMREFGATRESWSWHYTGALSLLALANGLVGTDVSASAIAYPHTLRSSAPNASGYPRSAGPGRLCHAHAFRARCPLSSTFRNLVGRGSATTGDDAGYRAA